MQDWYNMLGQELSGSVKSQAMEEIRQMLPEHDTRVQLRILDAACYSVRYDDGLELMAAPTPKSALRFLDLTGRYRLGACLAAAWGAENRELVKSKLRKPRYRICWGADMNEQVTLKELNQAG